MVEFWLLIIVCGIMLCQIIGEAGLILIVWITWVQFRFFGKTDRDFLREWEFYHADDYPLFSLIGVRTKELKDA